jgi:hypothetical protein
MSPWLVVSLWKIGGHCLVRGCLFGVGSLWEEIRSLYIEYLFDASSRLIHVGG